MLWTVVKLSENDNEVVIGYSSGKSEECDGTVIYDKKSEKAHVEKMSASSDDFDTSWMLRHIKEALRRGMKINQKRRIALG